MSGFTPYQMAQLAKSISESPPIELTPEEEQELNSLMADQWEWLDKFLSAWNRLQPHEEEK